MLKTRFPALIQAPCGPDCLVFSQEFQAPTRSLDVRQSNTDVKSDSSTQFSIASEMTEDEVFHVYPWVFEPIQAPKQRTCHTEDFIVSIQTSVKRGSRRIGENGGSDILTRMEAFASASIRSLSRCLFRDCVFRQRQRPFSYLSFHQLQRLRDELHFHEAHFH